MKRKKIPNDIYIKPYVLVYGNNISQPGKRERKKDSRYLSYLNTNSRLHKVTSENILIF